MYEPYFIEKARDMGKNAKISLEKKEPFLVGEATVVSTGLHSNAISSPGKIIVSGNVASLTESGSVGELGELIHIDIFHKPAVINANQITKRIWESMINYLDCFARKDDNLIGELGENQLAKEQINEAALKLTNQMFLRTATGEGIVKTLAGPGGKIKRFAKKKNRVHIVWRIPVDLLELLVVVIDAVEEGVIVQGAELRKIEGVSLSSSGLLQEEEEEESGGISIPLPFPGGNFGLEESEVSSSGLLKLALSIGSVEDLKNIISSLTFGNRGKLSDLQRRHPDLECIMGDLMAEKLVEKGLGGRYNLTGTGKEALSYLNENGAELEMGLKKSIGQYSAIKLDTGVRHRTSIKSRRKYYTDYRRVKRYSADSRAQSIAVSETVFNAALKRYVKTSGNIAGVPIDIDEEDIVVYDQRSYQPVDVCLLVDSSGSMAGNKIRAVTHLCQFVLAKFRDKVAVVSFQKNYARVATPFTRNFNVLQRSVASIIPQGLTPLAHGIEVSRKMIKESKAKNPLLVIITDGLPNQPLWTTCAQSDSFRAAHSLVKEKIGLLCIGLTENKEFLEQLTDVGNGSLSLLPDLTAARMVSVLEEERKRLCRK